MTKTRTHGSIEAAVDIVRVMLGTEALDVTEKSESLVRAWGDPDNDTHNIPLFQAVRLDAAYVASQGGKPPIFSAYEAAYLRAVYKLGGMPEHTPAHPLDRVASLVTETAKAVEAYKDSTCPKGPGGKKITQNEADAVMARIAAIQSTLEGLTSDIEVLAGQPREAA